MRPQSRRRAEPSSVPGCMAHLPFSFRGRGERTGSGTTPHSRGAAVRTLPPEVIQALLLSPLLRPAREGAGTSGRAAGGLTLLLGSVSVSAEALRVGRPHPVVGEVRSSANTCLSPHVPPRPSVCTLPSLLPLAQGRRSEALWPGPSDGTHTPAGPGRSAQGHAQGQALCSETPQERGVGRHLSGVSGSERP